MEYAIYEREIFINKFIPFLKELDSLNENEEYVIIRKKIMTLNKYINSIITRSKDNLEKLRCGLTTNKIDEEIKRFYTNFLKCFDTTKQVFRFLFKTVNQLYRKRIYQMNHLNGHFKRILNELGEKPIFERYIFLNLFLDYYESFAVFLRPFIVKLCEKEQNRNFRANFTANELYRDLFPLYFNIDAFTGVFRNDIRNIIAHNDYLIDPNDFSIEYFKRSIQRRRGKRLNIQPEKQYKKLYNLTVWFTTEFDIRINEMMREQSSSTFNHYWSRYFEEYVRSWKEYHKDDWNKSSVS